MEKDTIKKLSEKLPVEAIQSTKGAETHKGYDTDGYSYQYCVDRLNEVCGDGWGFDWTVILEEKGAYNSGKPFHDVTVKVSIWVGDITRPRSCAGGHISETYADALKGAITNGFKKTAAFWGVGRDAYAGTIDDDNKPMPDSLDNVATKPAPESKPAPKAEGKYNGEVDALPADYEDAGISAKDYFDDKKKSKELRTFPYPEIKAFKVKGKWVIAQKKHEEAAF